MSILILLFLPPHILTLQKSEYTLTSEFLLTHASYKQEQLSESGLNKIVQHYICWASLVAAKAL